MENAIEEIKVSYTSNSSVKPKISSSEDAYNLFLSCWSKHTIELQEEFKILLLNRANKVMGIYSCSKGGSSSTTVDVKLIFAVILKSTASSVILAHNHPSGSLIASQADKNLTKKIREAGKLLDIEVLDHLIVTKAGFMSFLDKGLM